jgi:hypothetical protein
MKIERILIVVLALALTFTLGMQQGFARGVEPGANTLHVSEVAAAALGDGISIQGKLTNASGAPLNGSHNITASLYDVTTGGTARCSDTDPVTVTNGLFEMEMSSCTSDNIDGDQLYLGIKVNSDAEMTPRQKIRAVPYAFTVRPGAIVKGATSYVFVPGSAGQWDEEGAHTDFRLTRAYYGGVLFEPPASYVTNVKYNLPITLPSVLYGQPVRVTSVTVYFSASEVLSYISSTALYRFGSAGIQPLVIDTTDRDATHTPSYTLTTNSAYNTLSADNGFLCMEFQLHFAASTQTINIQGVRLTLTHNY